MCYEGTREIVQQEGCMPFIQAHIQSLVPHMIS